MSSYDHFDEEKAREAWASADLKPRPGFGFYPDYVWDALEGFTAVRISFLALIVFFFNYFLAVIDN